MKRTNLLLPVPVILESYRRRQSAVASHLADFTNLRSLDLTTIGKDELLVTVARVLKVVQPVSNDKLLPGSVGILRFALIHLINGHDPVEQRFENCASPSGPYFVPGIGPRFWAALAKSIAPNRTPLFWPEILEGAKKLGLLDSSANRFDDLIRAYQAASHLAPDFTATDWDTICFTVAMSPDRQLRWQLPSVVARHSDRLRHSVRVVRSRTSLRKRIKSRSSTDAVELILSGFSPLAVIGVRSYHDALVEGCPADVEAKLFEEFAHQTCEQERIHPLELNDVFAEYAAIAEPNSSDGFAGFCTESFEFFDAFAKSPTQTTLAELQSQYQSTVREPLRELCGQLRDDYLRPRLVDGLGWPIDTTPQIGHALSSIRQQNFVTQTSYADHLELRFGIEHSRRTAAELFFRIDAGGTQYGLRLNRRGSTGTRSLVALLPTHGEALFHAIAHAPSFHDWVWRTRAGILPMRSLADFRTWLQGQHPSVNRERTREELLTRPDHLRESLVGDLISQFEQMLPLFAAASGLKLHDLLPEFHPETVREGYTIEQLLEESLSDESWLQNCLSLLKTKRQLFLHGSSGTGKTHLAAAIGKYLTANRDAAVRYVPIHPGWGYADFLERSLPNRPDTGPQYRDGVLVEFAARANRDPSRPYVLILDDLPNCDIASCLGEAFAVLEYRREPITLAASGRSFTLPKNLFLIATGRLDDARGQLLDAALRRRFAFVECEPDSAKLRRWFVQYPVATDEPGFTDKIILGYDRLNQQLKRDLGPRARLGFSPLLIQAATRDRLKSVWTHHVLPMIAQTLPNGFDDLLRYHFENFFGDE